ncbi:hypothetical protein QJS04_geneDACA024071 [Acorus gramineus]|uniref:Uncharacterized protein n=1 Tax=Acorus gramineus TaxID=55184 RepID=A0AAV9A1I1_ACOGR|nr:hypothetical protein QJS04_geneDACA024071 [Acorus gramineus]
MHLRLEFEAIRAHILHRSPKPSLDTVLFELVAEETRLRTIVTPPIVDQSSVNVAHRQDNRHTRVTCY